MISSVDDRLSDFVVAHFRNHKTPVAVFTAIPETGELKDCLTPDERTRASRFHFRSDHDSFVAAHTIMRLALGAMTCQAPEDVPLDLGSHGKPKLGGAWSGVPIEFSLSHTKGVVAFAVTHHAPIGIDVEFINSDMDTGNLAERYLAVQETDLLSSVPDTERQSAFFQLWTIKEAYIKGIGLGLSQSLNSFFVEALDHKSRICDSLTGTPLNWITQSCQPTPEHFMSSAIERREACDCEITFLELPFLMIG